MNCSYCRSWNADDEPRCRRCGRRLSGTLSETSPEAFSISRTAGALATQPKAARREPTVETPPPAETPAGPPMQRSLFAERPVSKIIPFDSIPGSRPAPAPVRTAAPPPSAAAAAAAPAPARVRRSTPARPPDTTQGTLDFLPSAAAAPRTLRTTVEAVIFCDAPVATPVHRAVSAALDLSMVLIAFGLFLWTYRLGGGTFVLDRLSLIAFGSAFAVILLFYGLVWALVKSETPGMRWTHLRLTDFDGFPPDGPHRLLRYVGTCLSISAAGLGILWALVDEEMLTWQDHISKTFPTLRDLDRSFVRRG